MSDRATAAVVIAGAYLLGSIPWGLILARARGIDIRSVGSGNIGATNVARNLGKRLGLVVLALDALKGAVPMWLVGALGLGAKVSPYVVTATGLAAIVGHCFPVWLKFRGGKGVATALGVFLVLDPAVTAVGIVVFAGMYALFRVASLGSVSATIAVPLLLWLVGRPPASVLLGAAGAAIIIFKHRKNLARLIKGSELKV